MTGRPEASEAAHYYWKYIDLVPGEDAVAAIDEQLANWEQLFASVTEESSLHRYAEGKWSIRELLSHVTDTERAFAFRVLWFGRGFTTPLASFDQDIAAAGAGADRIPWAAHVEEFRHVRLSTVALLRHLTDEAWQRSGVASDHRVTVRALAFMIAGHAAHHIAILRERYLNSASAAAL